MNIQYFLTTRTSLLDFSSRSNASAKSIFKFYDKSSSGLLTSVNKKNLFNINFFKKTVHNW